MAAIVYMLCALTSLACALLLIRQHRLAKNRFLFWSSAGFFVFFISNAILFIDLILLPSMDLSTLRLGITFLGVALILFGLIWENV